MTTFQTASVIAPVRAGLFAGTPDNGAQPSARTIAARVPDPIRPSGIAPRATTKGSGLAASRQQVLELLLKLGKYGATPAHRVCPEVVL